MRPDKLISLSQVLEHHGRLDETGHNIGQSELFKKLSGPIVRATEAVNQKKEGDEIRLAMDADTIAIYNIQDTLTRLVHVVSGELNRRGDDHIPLALQFLQQFKQIPCSDVASSDSESVQIIISAPIQFEDGHIEQPSDEYQTALLREFGIIAPDQDWRDFVSQQSTTRSEPIQSPTIPGVRIVSSPNNHRVIVLEIPTLSTLEQLQPEISACREQLKAS